MKIVIKAENRAYPDNIGDYLWESLKPAADQLGIELIRLPVIKSAKDECIYINQVINPDLFIFFSNYVPGTNHRKISEAYSQLNCKVMFWSREDPNHFGFFKVDAINADIIGTCCSDCIPKYEERYPTKKVISLPMAVAPEIFYPPYRTHVPFVVHGRTKLPKPIPVPLTVKYSDREWDIVFLGNRYITRQIRNDAEQAVIIAAAKWAIANGKKMGVWGHDKGPFGWWNVPEIYKTGIYQGRVDRIKAADVYRNAKVALSIASNDYSPTMAPNRVVQIAACGTILIAYHSPATAWQTDENYSMAFVSRDTESYLESIFNETAMDVSIMVADKARAHVLAHHTFKHRLETILEAMK